MYQGTPSQSSCARAWIAAASSIVTSGDEGFNVVIDVKDASIHDADDNLIIGLVDRFLRGHDQNPIVTVANTIFPQSLYTSLGSPSFYAAYLEDFDALSQTKRWGRYFERMTRHRMCDGTTYNPLRNLIDKLKQQTDAEATYRNAYELAVYDPLLDSRFLRGGQCLSFLSFKVHRHNGLMLTAMYRNHAYISRCLGNLIGLGRLQAFVAAETGLKVGSLTVVSTHAELDTGDGWGIRDARKLVREADEVLRAGDRTRDEHQRPQAFIAASVATDSLLNT